MVRRTEVMPTIAQSCGAQWTDMGLCRGFCGLVCSDGRMAGGVPADSAGRFKHGILGRVV